MKQLMAFGACLFVFFSLQAQQDSLYTLQSIGNTTIFQVKVNKGQLVYRLSYEGQEVIAWSPLGLETTTGIRADSVVIKSSYSWYSGHRYRKLMGEFDRVDLFIPFMVLYCSSGGKDFQLAADIFNGAVAFEYRVKDTAGINGSILKEHTGFRFTEPYTLYQYNQESVFTPVSIDSLHKTCDLPATLTNGKLYVCIGEAANLNYTKAELTRGSAPHSLAVSFQRDSMVTMQDKEYITPFRTICVSKTAIGLHDFAKLNVILGYPDDVPDWVKPGKLIRSQLTTQSGLDCIDFAATHNLQYIMFDAGWYGPETRVSSDPTKVIPEIDMPKVIQHGKEKGIGVILYVNYVALKTKLDTILPLYKQWGVAGLKFGFIDGLTQQGLTWLTSAIEKVQNAGLILNIHDNYKPTGLSARFPALLTQEGIRGDENSPDAFHTTTLPFTRFIAGPGDFTFCYPNAKNRYEKNLKVSMAHQLALTVIYFSPLQSMFWYGAPKDYTNEQEIEFIKYVPTVWNESHYLAGDIGKGITVARRSGKQWFMGSAAGLNDWSATIKLDFLKKHKRYTATVYEDDAAGTTIVKRTVRVRRGDSWLVTLKGKCGQAVIFE